MIHLHIVLRGDNEELGKRQLVELLEKAQEMETGFASPSVYRAWVDRTDYVPVDEREGSG